MKWVIHFWYNYFREVESNNCIKDKKYKQSITIKWSFINNHYCSDQNYMYQNKVIQLNHDPVQPRQTFNKHILES